MSTIATSGVTALSTSPGPKPRMAWTTTASPAPVSGSAVNATAEARAGTSACTTTAIVAAAGSRPRSTSGSATGGSRVGFGTVPTGPVTVVVLDQIRRLRGEEAVARVLADGPAAGVVALCLSEDLPGLPAETTTSVVCTRSAADDLVVTVTHGPDSFADVVPEGVDARQAEVVARALAPLFEVGAASSDGTGGALPPPPIDHLGLLEMPEPIADSVLHRWGQARRASAQAPMGVVASGTFVLDLVRDGPHALVAGTTGAGKSELLQSLVAGLAASHPPRRAHVPAGRLQGPQRVQGLRAPPPHRRRAEQPRRPAGRAGPGFDPGRAPLAGDGLRPGGGEGLRRLRPR